MLASTAFANAEYYGFGRSDSANSGFFSMEKNKILIEYIYIKLIFINIISCTSNSYNIWNKTHLKKSCTGSVVVKSHF